MNIRLILIAFKWECQECPECKGCPGCPECQECKECQECLCPCPCQIWILLVMVMFPCLLPSSQICPCQCHFKIKWGSRNLVNFLMCIKSKKILMNFKNNLKKFRKMFLKESLGLNWDNTQSLLIWKMRNK